MAFPSFNDEFGPCNRLTEPFRMALLTLLFSVISIPGFAAEPGWQLSVDVDKVVYLPGSAGRAKVTFVAPSQSGENLVLRSRLEFGLDRRVDLKEVAIGKNPTESVTVPFVAPSEAWGCLIVTELTSDGTILARAQDVFAVGTDSYRLGQMSCHGGDLAKAKTRLFQTDDSFWPVQWRAMKGTWIEIFCGQPSEFSGLKTDWDQWVSMQGRYRRSKSAIRAFTAAAHRLGMKVMLYNNATPSGWVGTSWARKHPEWLSYNYMGHMRADLAVEDIDKMKSWHETMTPHQTTFFHPLYLNFHDPNLTKFGCDQMLSASDDLGYDGVRFDGHWVIGDVWGGIGYDLQGRRPNRGKSLDEVSTRVLREMKRHVWKQKPDFLFGFNYGKNYEQGGVRNPDAYRMACSDGGMILWEGSTFEDDFSDWRVGALKLRQNALRVHQNGGIHYGQAHMLHVDVFSRNDFALRYLFITNFAATSHIYAGVYPEHPHYRPIQGLYYRFALRYGDLLFDENLRPVLHPEHLLSVASTEKESPDLWWKPYTYKRQLKDKYQIITHLVNIPVSGVNKTNSTPDKQPAPIRDVRITFADKPSRVFLLDPEATKWRQPLESSRSITIPELKAWKILVQEFPGSCDRIPVEVIPEADFKGRDLLPDPSNGRTVLPISHFLTDSAGIRIVDDTDAIFGYALRCDTRSDHQPRQVMFGPNQSMPTAAPGRTRIIFRLKVADNTSADKVCTVAGRFGSREIKGTAFRAAGVFQEFAFDYEVGEGESNYVSLEEYGLTELTVDSVVMQEIEPAHDRDFFSLTSLDLAGMPARQGTSKKAHLIRGLWHDYFGLDEALGHAGIESTESWERITTDHAIIPVGLPVSVSEMLEYDLIALLNVAGPTLQPVRRKNLREYVHRGGTLLVAGGTRAFGHGGYERTFLAEILPVEGAKFDFGKADGMAQLIRPAIDHPITNGISFSAEPRNFFCHDVLPKRGATVILEAGNRPILTVWKLDRGTVYAMTGTPLGESNQGIPWWEWDEWQTILARILAEASPGSEPNYQAVLSQKYPLLGQLDGTRDLIMRDGNGELVPLFASEGVAATSKGISFGYDDRIESQGVLAYSGGLIKPYGSISFKIRPGWEPELMALDHSVPLFWTRNESGAVFQIYIYVRELGGESFALCTYVRTKDIGKEELTDHNARYGIMNITHGGLRLLKKTLWKKGEERTVKVEWSPSQIVIWDNGERMASSDFAPEMDLSCFKGLLYIGSNSAKNLPHVMLRDIEIRGVRDH